MGSAPSLVYAGSFRRRELLSRRGALRAAFKVSGLPYCCRPAGAGIVFRKLRSTIESSGSGECATFGEGVELCASWKPLADPGYTSSTQPPGRDYLGRAIPSQIRQLSVYNPIRPCPIPRENVS